jgi:hypothetical protein
MSVSQYVPLSVAAKTREELSKKMLEVQGKQGGKVAIITIAQDLSTKEWVCWYYPLRSLGGGVF